MNKLSLRKYAAIIGVSHTAVIKAVKGGHIVSGWDAQNKKVIVDIANKEWGDTVKELRGHSRNIISNYSNEPIINNTTLSGEDLSSVKETISLSEARRRKEIYNAEIARITALKEQGLYVEKEKVYSQLFAFGQQIRTSLKNVAGQIIDKVRNEDNRMIACSILNDEIEKVLREMTSPPEVSTDR